jgi:hypothetical protein
VKNTRVTCQDKRFPADLQARHISSISQVLSLTAFARVTQYRFIGTKAFLAVGHIVALDHGIPVHARLLPGKKNMDEIFEFYLSLCIGLESCCGNASWVMFIVFIKNIKM